MNGSSTPPAATGPGDQLRERRAAIAADLVHRQFAADPALEHRYGPAGRAKCLEDAHYHLSYLADAMNTGSPDIFSNYVAWAKVMLAKRGVPSEDLARHLVFAQGAVRAGLDEPSAAIAVEYLSLAIDSLQSPPSELPTCIPPQGPHALLARTYLAALLVGDRRTASQLVLDAVAAGVSVRDVYLHVFQPAQHEIGRLWQVNEISVGQEHYCTAATQLIMSQLYPQICAVEKTVGSLVATCVSGDLHEIGLRMVADFCEMDGWSTFYLGASTPAQSVIDTVVQRRASVLAISATIAPHLDAVRDLIRRVRATPACADVKVIVGGYPFVVMPDLWRSIGADGSAPDAAGAAALARRLTTSRTAGGDATRPDGPSQP